LDAELVARAEAQTIEFAALASDEPLDSMQYGCQCGYQFTASVETGVRCPHCGTTLAW
jgi:predicted Zn-ribbon and HTH transcriptional regulator